LAVLKYDDNFQPSCQEFKAGVKFKA